MKRVDRFVSLSHGQSNTIFFAARSRNWDQDEESRRACGTGGVERASLEPRGSLVRDGVDWKAIPTLLVTLSILVIRQILITKSHQRTFALLRKGNGHKRLEAEGTDPSALLQRSSGRKMSWTIYRIPVRPFDYTGTEGQPAGPKTVTYRRSHAAVFGCYSPP
jgi:hypothetical protein